MNIDNIMAAKDVFGPNLGSLKGNTMGRASLAVTVTWLAIPPDI